MTSVEMPDYSFSSTSEEIDNGNKNRKNFLGMATGLQKVDLLS